MIFYYFIYFLFGFNDHGVVPALIFMCFDLSAPTQRTAVLFFTYNMVVKRHSTFIALGFLSVVGFMGYMLLVSVNP